MPRIEIFHNVNKDASLGLNTVFEPNSSESGYIKRAAQTDAEKHELVRVFEYDTEWIGEKADPYAILNKAWETFNIGSDELAAQYRARRLRSLSFPGK